MFVLSSLWLLLADDPPAANPASPFGAMLTPMIIIGFIWYFLLVRPQRKEQSRREDLLNSIKKNDRVVTIGGIIGTVAFVDNDKKEVTVKVDDNTRLKFLRSAIQTVLRDDAGEAGKPPAEIASVK